MNGRFAVTSTRFSPESTAPRADAIITSRNGHVMRIADVERLCPNVSREMIRVVMNQWRKEGRLEVLGRGRDARWRRLGCRLPGRRDRSDSGGFAETKA